MADDSFEDPEVWNEYEWERFLQQQDRTTEKYFHLLDRYMDHPERDQLIAKEMGWEDIEEDEEAMELFCEAGEEEDDFDAFTSSPVYADTLKLHTWVNAWLERLPSHIEEPEAVKMASSCALCGAKLAAALCGVDDTEIGMTIAYLKRGLKAANDALEAAAKLTETNTMTARHHRFFLKLLFRVRDRIVDLMAHYRTEWYRRHGRHD